MDSDSSRLIAKRYALVRALGRGGMGVVWEGRDTLLNRQCAVKEVVLPAGLPQADRERQLVRTAREARTAAQLNHPSVVAVYDVVEEEGRPWIIMELVRAPSVEEVVATMGALPVRQAADVGRQVLSALVAAHAQGILHRDVKPSNVLLADDGRAVLTDFGIATTEGEASLTKTGMVTGSPGFLAPERVRGTEAGPASDLWSLGATLYATLVGRSPFERGEPMETLKAILDEEPDYRRIPPAMHPVLQGLLRKDPAERVGAQEADELLAAVLQTRSAADERDAPPSGASRGLARTVAAAAAAAVLVVSAGAVAYFRSGGPAEGASQLAHRAAATSPMPSAPPTVVTPTPVETVTPTPTPTPTRARAVLRPWTSPAGWTIKRPTGWRGARGEHHAEWTHPRRMGHLSVEAVYARLDLNQLLRDEEETLRAQGADDLRSLSRKKVRHHGARAVEWEFVWTAGEGNGTSWAAPGRQYHELRRAVLIDDTAYILSWTFTEAQWQSKTKLMRRVIGSFTVGA
ncbi:serine/threonine-protein kinase [Nonomuraea sp. NPDC049649]|uniref:serine/threonine-protein kinase n=1 Tax=Nonomuraea sp. NPDC049649 TaxID=3155776 RepID=UPI0034303F67